MGCVGRQGRIVEVDRTQGRYTVDLGSDPRDPLGRSKHLRLRFEHALLGGRLACAEPDPPRAVAAAG
jgi:hypothetical protein